MDDVRCTQCGAVGIQPGYLSDRGQGARGFAEWFAGALTTNLVGAAKFRGRRRLRVEAYRCMKCGHLELFA